MLHLVMLVLMLAPPLFASANVFRLLCVRGSRPRFLLATVCRATLGPALAEPVLSGADVLVHGAPVGLPFAAVMLAIVVHVARSFLGDDDDDWFTRPAAGSNGG